MSNIPNLILMIRPKSFGYNYQTASSNYFQHDIKGEDLSGKAQFEFDLMVKKLERSGIEVKIFEDINDNLPDSVFSNNWISHFPSGKLIIYPMLNENRRLEVRKDIQNWITGRIFGEIIDLSECVNESLFLEGTGSIVFDHEQKIAYACKSPRTNISLFNRLCDEIGYDAISFVSKDKSGNQIYHTNVMMSVSSSFVIISLETFENQNEREMVVKIIEKSGKILIPITFDQLNNFAGNSFEVLNQDGVSHLIMSKSALNSMAKLQLEKIDNFSKVISISIPTIETIGGGSVRCMMTGLFA